MKNIALAVTATGLMLASAPASASTVIDFQDVSSGGCAIAGSSVSSRGFTFTGNDTMFICDAGVIGNNTSAALIDANVQSIVNFSASDSSVFSLNSFFAGTRTAFLDPNSETSFYGLTTGVEVVGNLFGGGTVSSIFDFNGLQFDQFLLDSNFTNLTSVTITAIGDANARFPEFLIDDINVNGAFAGAVPEPATWAFMIFGFGVIGGGMRRQRKASVTVSYA